jgi:hypothetical protein
MARWVLIYVCGVGSPRGGEVFAEVVYKAFQFVDAGFKSPFVGGESIMVDLQPIVGDGSSADRYRPSTVFLRPSSIAVQLAVARSASASSPLLS